MGGGEKVLFHGVANVRPMTSESTSITLKICSRLDMNPLCFLQNLSVKEKLCLMKWLFDFKWEWARVFYGEIKKNCLITNSLEWNGCYWSFWCTVMGIRSIAVGGVSEQYWSPTWYGTGWSDLFTSLLLGQLLYLGCLATVFIVTHM